MKLTKEMESYLTECVSIDPLRLQEAFANIPAELAYWNEQYAEALRKQLHAKIEKDRLSAQIFFEKRVELKESDIRPTEAVLKAAVESDARYNVARSEEADAHAEAIRLKGVAEAVRTKRDMLVSLGAHVRAEMDGDPHIKAQHRHAHMTTDDL